MQTAHEFYKLVIRCLIIIWKHWKIFRTRVKKLPCHKNLYFPSYFHIRGHITFNPLSFDLKMCRFFLPTSKKIFCIKTAKIFHPNFHRHFREIEKCFDIRLRSFHSPSLHTSLRANFRDKNIVLVKEIPSIIKGSQRSLVWARVEWGRGFVLQSNMEFVFGLLGIGGLDLSQFGLKTLSAGSGVCEVHALILSNLANPLISVPELFLVQDHPC